MGEKTKKLKIKFDESKTVTLNGDEVPFEQWVEDYLIPLLIVFGAISVEEE